MEAILSHINAPILLIALLGLNLLLLLFCIALSVRTSRIRKSTRRLLAGTDGANLEAGLHRVLDQLEAVKQEQAEQRASIHQLSNRLASQCGNVAIVRYNAFGNTGGDLSFSIALLDDAQNGIVITSIYGREESRVYAKPVERGSSTYNLSEEELAAIRKAASRNR